MGTVPTFMKLSLLALIISGIQCKRVDRSNGAPYYSGEHKKPPLLDNVGLERNPMITLTYATKLAMDRGNGVPLYSGEDKKPPLLDNVGLEPVETPAYTTELQTGSDGNFPYTTRTDEDKDQPLTATTVGVRQTPGTTNPPYLTGTENATAFHIIPATLTSVDETQTPGTTNPPYLTGTENATAFPIVPATLTSVDETQRFSTDPITTGFAVVIGVLAVILILALTVVMKQVLSRTSLKKPPGETLLMRKHASKNPERLEDGTRLSWNDQISNSSKNIDRKSYLSGGIERSGDFSHSCQGPMLTTVLGTTHPGITVSN